MKRMLALSRQRRLWVCGWIAACTMVASQLGAQSATPRITSEITNSEQAMLHGSLHPMAQAQYDAGRVPAATKLSGISIFFSRTAEQEAALQELITAQQDPASPLYQQWVTPDEFAARFGVADTDLAKVKGWLQQQGFSVDSVARSRNMIRFSGTARQVEGAFSTEMHYYNVQGEQHFAPATELSVPSALASVVLAVRNLNDFRPRPMHIAPSARPEFTSNVSPNHVFFAPGDIKTAYNIPSSYTGAGQSIAVLGQSAILTTDIENFQNAAGLTVKDPTLVLVPGSGSSHIYSGDESESDIDLEWSGAIATGANIFFVYAGSNMNIYDSLLYAVDQDIAPIISISYGTCEGKLSGTDILTYEAAGVQAIAQGQTIIVSSGDAGSTACSGTSGLSTATQQALSVNYPASSAYVTAMGGTEITTANDVAGNPPGYWTAGSSADVINSALQWIPEVAWNDDLLSGASSSTSGGGLSASGGGASALVARPSWQTGVTGIPAGTMRLVPDIALYSSPNYPGYLYCSSDSTVNVTQSCANGFRDGNNQYLTVAGGTSFAAPIFAGMVALINQAKGYTSGQGLINPKLYTLASNSSNYASAFHDVSTGNNFCTAGTTYGYCSSAGATEGFAAGTGYDEVTGLGSVNLTNLIGAWTANATPLISTTTTISATTLSPAAGATDTFTITVTAASGTTAPSGNVKLSIDGGGTQYSNINSGTTVSVALVASATPGKATATYSTSFSATGVHQIVAQYLGSGTFALSTGVIQVVAGGTSSGAGSFTLGASPSTLTVTQGSSGTETMTVTPAGGYTGTVLMNYTTSNNTALANLCVFAVQVSGNYAAVTVTGTSAVQTTLTFDTNAAECAAGVSPAGGVPLHILSGTKISRNNVQSPLSLGVAFAGLLLVGFLGRHSRKFQGIAGVIVLLAVGLAISACGSSSSTSTTTTTPPANPAKGSYTITLTGHDSVTSSITAQTSFTLVIQ